MKRATLTAVANLFLCLSVSPSQATEQLDAMKAAYDEALEALVNQGFDKQQAAVVLHTGCEMARSNLCGPNQIIDNINTEIAQKGARKTGIPLGLLLKKARQSQAQIETYIAEDVKSVIEFCGAKPDPAAE